MALFDQAPRRRKRILVAEDDPEMRRVLVDALTSDGHDVASVSDGGALLMQLARSNAHNFNVVDLVISDMRMPVCSGLQALETLHAIRPHVGVVLVTAFPDEHLYQRAARISVNVLEKPFTIAQLRETVAQRLGEANPKRPSIR